MMAFDPKRRTTPGGEITIALYRISQVVDLLLRRAGKKAGLSPAQIQSLLFLQYARRGVRTIGGLAERLGVSPATTSGVVDALENKRLVQRTPRLEDQRVITLGLTPLGMEKAGELEGVLAEIEAAVNGLSHSQQQALLAAAQSVVRRLQNAGYINVYEMCWGCQFFHKDAHPADPGGPHHCKFMDAPLSEPDTYLECPDFTPRYG